MTHEEPTARPKSVICPACNSGVGKPCTQPDDFGRHEVKTFHWSRLDLAAHTSRMLAEEAADDLDALPVTPVAAEDPKPTDEPLELPAELDDSAQWWSPRPDDVRKITAHEPCGQMMIDTNKNRELHRSQCRAIETRLTIDQLREARATQRTTTEESEAIRNSLAETRSMSRTERARRDRQLTEERYRRMGLRPFTIYAEGYSANEGTSGATSMGTHWGATFDDAIRRWMREDPEAARLLSNTRGRWTYWGCKLFDNLRDAQRSFG